MLTSKHRPRPTNNWLKLATGLVLAMWTAHSAWSLHSSSQSASRARQNLVACRNLAEEIQRVRRLPVRVSSRELNANELSDRVSATIQRAGIAPGTVRLIEPGSSSRADNRSYSQQSATMRLEQIDLASLLTLVTELSHEDAGTEVTAVTLTVPTSEESLTAAGEELWDVEVRLTRLTRSP